MLLDRIFCITTSCSRGCCLKISIFTTFHWTPASGNIRINVMEREVRATDPLNVVRSRRPKMSTGSKSPIPTLSETPRLIQLAETSKDAFLQVEFSKIQRFASFSSQARKTYINLFQGARQRNGVSRVTLGAGVWNDWAESRWSSPELPMIGFSHPYSIDAL